MQHASNPINFPQECATMLTMLRRVYLGIFVAILCCGAFLRLYKLGSIPDGLYWDEVAMYVDARAISETGHDMHGRPWYQIMYPSYGDYKLSVYIWLAGASFRLFGASEWALRLPSALAGIATIVVTGGLAYHITKRHFSRHESQRISLLTMGVVAIAPWSIMFSRTGFESHVGQLLVGCSMLLLVSGNGRQWRRWVGAALLGGVATYAYFSVRFVWPVVIGGYWLWIVTSSKHFHVRKYLQALPLLLLAALVYMIVLLPMLKSPLYVDSTRFRLGTDSVLKMHEQILESNVLREVAGNTRLDRVFFHRYWLVGRELLKNYADHFDLSFLFITGDSNQRHGTGLHGLFLLPFLPFFLWGWYCLWRKQNWLTVWMLLWWLAALLPASVPTNTPHALRSLNALIPLALVIAIGAGESITYVWQAKFGGTRYVAGLGLMLLVGVSFLQFWHYYVQMYPVISAKDWQGKYREVAQTIEQLKQVDEMVYVIPFDDKFYLWLMAYGSVHPVEWQTWHSTNYQFNTVPGVIMEHLESRTTPGISSSVLVAGKTESIQELTNKGIWKVKEVHTIIGPDGVVWYQVARIAPSTKGTSP